MKHLGRVRSQARSFIVAASVLGFAWAVAAWDATATSNTIPKFAVGGDLVDSSVREVNGKVGLGLANPSATLHIAGAPVTSAWNSYGQLVVSHNVATIPSASQDLFGGIVIGRDKPTALVAGDSLGGINFGAGPDAGEVRGGYAAIGALRGATHGTGLLTFHTASISNIPAERLRISSSGNVGIGTQNPTARLQIAGGPMTSPWNSYGQLVVSHNVATIPAASQELFGGIVIGRDKASALAPGDALGGINFGAGPDAGEVRGGYAAIGALRGGAPGTGHLTFHTSTGSNTPVERMRIGSGGQVGIGTATPSQMLHVAGNVHVEGNIAAKYQDVAEWVDVDEVVGAGVVLVAARRAGRPSMEAYDTSVIGVVSVQPGVILGERAPGRVAVAQSGRVRVKVDARYGPIRVGDLLVTSGTKGHAMRSMPLEVGQARLHRPGTIIGKALEPLSSGRGEILALITLQ